MTQVRERALPLVRRLPEPGAARPDQPEAHRGATPQPAYRPVPTGMPRRVELVLRLVLEVLAGRRPVAQLRGLVTPPVLRYLAAEVSRPSARPGPHRQLARQPAAAASQLARQPAAGAAVARGAQLRAVRVCRPCEAAAEVSAVWPREGRFRALAARFELLDTPDGEPRWCCTALRLG